MSLRRFTAVLALLAPALLIVPPAGAAEGPSSQSFSAIANCPSQSFVVPADVTAVMVEAWGGSGGHNEHTGVGGAGAYVRANVAVTPGESLTLVVGAWGDAHGGCGQAQGGDRGGADGADHSGRDAYGGGSGTVVQRGGTPLVVAGGGGGGGGNGNSSGGDGGNGGYPANSPAGDGQMGNGGGYGGCGSCWGAWQGTSGDDQNIGWGGGGGGGGGGYPQAGQGGHTNAVGGGGGGGAGGSFALDPQALTHPSDRTCTWPDYSPTCDGAVTISWDVTPASVTASGGSGQQTDAGTSFAQRLQATVLNAEGQPVEGVSVAFALPASGPSARWTGGGAATVTASTDANGVAVSPLLRANDVVGAWRATATAASARPASFALTNTRAATTTRVSSSADPSVAGQPVTFTATITSASTAAEAWGGTVRFFDGGVQLGSAVAVTANGTATSPPIAFGIGASPVGEHQITALFSGDGDHDPSTSAAYDQRVQQAPTATTVTSDLNPDVSGGPAPVLTATVSTHAATTATPTGTVQFSYAAQPGGIPVDVGTPVTLDGAGVATATLPPLADGAYDVVAAYSGAAPFTRSDGTLVQTVGADATATTLASSVNPAVFGEPFELTATVARSGAGADPSGAVTFTTGGQTLCDEVALASGTALCPWNHPLVPGADVIAGAFADPAAQYEPSSGTVTQQVTAAATATTLTALPASTAYGAPVQLRATVAVVAPGAGLTDGTIQFSADGVALGAPVEVVRGVALSPPLSGLTPGPHTLAADYVDDSAAPELQLLPSRGGATHVVTPAPTTLALASGRDPAEAGEAVVFTATPASGGSAPAVAGDVQFLVDGAPLGGPVEIAGGVATSPAARTLKPGTHTVTAELNGGADFLPATATLRQTITALPVPPVRPDGRVGPILPPRPLPPAQPLVSIGDARVLARADGVVDVPLACSGPAGSRCVGGVRLASATRLSARMVGGSGSRAAGLSFGGNGYSLAAGAPARVAVRLAPAAQRALVARGRVAVLVRVDPAAGAVPAPRRLVVVARRAPALAIASRSLRAGAGGRVAVSLRCAGVAADASEHCRGTLSAALPGGRTLGSARVVVREGRAATATVALSAAGRRSLVAAGRLRVRLRTVTAIPAGPPTTRQRELTLAAGRAR